MYVHMYLDGGGGGGGGLSSASVWDRSGRFPI